MGSRPIALIADVGESFGNYTFGNDEALLQILSTTNVACGFQAGDPRTMDLTVGGCVKNQIEVGAHPGYPDLVGFGRRKIEATEDEIRTDVLYQLGALSAFARAHGTRISHICPHGGLGSLTSTDPLIARAVIRAAEAFDSSLIVIAPPGELADQAANRGFRVARVFLADRGYADDGHPVWRDHPAALLRDPVEIGRRVVQLIERGTVASVDGSDIHLGFDPDVVLVHGDHPQAVQNAASVRRSLEAASVPILGVEKALEGKAEGIGGRITRMSG
jgi:UPF0271 protein